jgi:hypothetical protein
MKLSANGMRNPAISKGENAFYFIFGHNDCSCTSFVGGFLCSEIAPPHTLDVSICDIHVETKDHKQGFEQFFRLDWV